MGLLAKIFGADIAGAGDLVKKVVGSFKLDPETKARLELAVIQNQHELARIDAELEAKLAEYQAREIEAASSNIRAEAQSGDKFTSRARPTFMYVVNAILAVNYLVIPLFFPQRSLINLPQELVWLFGVSITGYTAFRSMEKSGKFPWGNGHNGNGK